MANLHDGTQSTSVIDDGCSSVPPGGELFGEGVERNLRLGAAGIASTAGEEFPITIKTRLLVGPACGGRGDKIVHPFQQSTRLYSCENEGADEKGGCSVVLRSPLFRGRGCQRQYLGKRD